MRLLLSKAFNTAIMLYSPKPNVYTAIKKGRRRRPSYQCCCVAVESCWGRRGDDCVGSASATATSQERARGSSRLDLDPVFFQDGFTKPVRAKFDNVFGFQHDVERIF